MIYLLFVRLTGWMVPRGVAVSRAAPGRHTGPASPRYPRHPCLINEYRLVA